MLGGPGDVGGPSSAAAISQALHWLDPPSGTVLHVRSVETMGGRTTTRELWRSADHPAAARQVERTKGAGALETAGPAFYDPATNTIYDGPQQAGSKSTLPPELKTAPAADPIVEKVRYLLQKGRMRVTGRERHNGTDAWVLSLRSDLGRPVWTLWVSAADGRPLELRDPGRDANEPPQTIRWPTYEVLPGANADHLVTLTGAHPSARVVRDPAEVGAAQRRLMLPTKG
jgi:hypothetical protein